jgi:hypothetical protein
LIRLIVFLFFAVLFAVKFPLAGFDRKEKVFTYVGSKVCRECHGEDAIGNQYRIWMSSPHSKAYNRLLGGEAAEIAKKLKITNPEKSTECLQCHATGKGAAPGIVKEGVGCEACHGPGSGYHKAGNHVDYSDREKGYRKAITFGMYPIRGITSLRTRERLCLSCHKNDRPCFPEKVDDPYRYKMPIQVIDSLRKGEVNFRHPLRR